ncbi:MAG: 4-hydroxythreonine-4-phosphate dehydrogenase PdxA, partial [Bacteroidales bacterium]|nr:4-hydroxythreonine-4-phosphate dehydrogenase PdxA [Bacteroidales bacterium]
MKNKIVVGITQGDSNGIGYEVIIKSLSDQRVFDICTPIIYGSSKFFGYYKKSLQETENISTNVITKSSDAHSKRINLINCIPDNLLIEPGKASEDGARAALISLEAAVKDLKDGNIDVLVTAPFNKSGVSKEGFSFPGHTEYLTKYFSAEESLMFMVSDSLKIGLVTNHLSISDVAESITTSLVKKKVLLMSDSLKRDFAVDRPKIAVLSLNPHSGDHGLLGKEEQEIITPAINELFEQGELVFGPFSSDGFFGSDYIGKFDAVLAMYHDQGMIPFKTISFDKGVNFTAGLSVVRCSPDHGTAYDLAGK